MYTSEVHSALQKSKKKKKKSVLQQETESSKNKGTGVKERREQKHDIGHFPDGPMEPATLVSEVRTESYNLSSSYEWIICNLNNDSMYTEVYNLLKEHFSNTEGGKCDYSQKYLTWALHPPGHFRDWHIGVRDKKSRRLVGFISGVPARIRVCDKVVKMAEIKLLCLERSLKKQKLARFLINELTGRVHLKDMVSGLYLR
ncbi:Glycylpeptide N-tetradecanoyltransferase 1 [Cardamine amara subsp. amara]|uniref:glycylpeptide N-tetradecanoyltransferase n=1 Tax=Cardamine amara subsp. amara TaxID=228776 RepID=A0ABD1BYZ9_CARAN